MNLAELALHHQRISQQAAQLRAGVQRVEARLASDPDVVRLEEELQLARQERRALELKLRKSEQEVEARRQRMQGRERELMSGRIKNPTELMKLSAEAARLRAAMIQEEDGELVLLEDAEHQDDRLLELERKLEQARAVVKAAQPSLELQLEGDRTRLQQLEAEREEVWGRLPDTWQTQYQRVQARTSDPVAEVVGAQCQGCHVGVTTSGMQTLRRGGLIRCDNCGRLLVVT